MEVTAHRDMKDARVEKLSALDDKPVPTVEGDRVHLRMQKDSAEAPLARRFHEPREHCRTYPASAPGTKHSHAPYMAVRKQSRRADGLPRDICGHRVQGIGIELVPFQLGRHALLLHEDRLAYRRGDRSRFAPANDPDRVRSLHAVFRSGWVAAV
jgi:hypothetical protein